MPATPLLPCLPITPATAPATVKALMLPLDPARTSSLPLARSSQIRALCSRVAMVSRLILLTAIAAPTEPPLALPELPPFAIASDSPPAIAKMSAASLACTSASLADKPARKLSLLSTIRARVAPLIAFSDTEPASDPAMVLALLALPFDTAPPRPAARVQMSPVVAASTLRRRSGLTLAVVALSGALRNVMPLLLTRASVADSMAFQLKAPARAAAFWPSEAGLTRSAFALEYDRPPLPATMRVPLSALTVSTSVITTGAAREARVLLLTKLTAVAAAMPTPVPDCLSGSVLAAAVGSVGELVAAEVSVPESGLEAPCAWVNLPASFFFVAIAPASENA